LTPAAVLTAAVSVPFAFAVILSSVFRLSTVE